MAGEPKIEQRLAIAVFEAVKAACELPDHEERRRLVRAMTDALINLNSPVIMYDGKTAQ
jgi:hypothetical protein